MKTIFIDNESPRWVRNLFFKVYFHFMKKEKNELCSDHSGYIDDFTETYYTSYGETTHTRSIKCEDGSWYQLKFRHLEIECNLY